jgi:hypothetical protein
MRLYLTYRLPPFALATSMSSAMRPRRWPSWTRTSKPDEGMMTGATWWKLMCVYGKKMVYIRGPCQTEQPPMQPGWLAGLLVLNK